MITTAIKETKAKKRDISKILMTAENSGISPEEIETYVLNAERLLENTQAN